MEEVEMEGAMGVEEAGAEAEKGPAEAALAVAE
jgi:hypothetical protein